ncbi:Hydroxyindole-O-methyltransferase [Handroanthus impetiginosus]|uniref:Hydroxyindole-O-methyltransferase n=1 Tax=Handroanthus impetiginosus TaxID=429701 RepID=A0A2G9HWT7_9LAMI|nr:Hydroxyindole-O-methyltransferase [Handroanthus impetiginosus]
MENAINGSTNSANIEEDEAFNRASAATASFVLPMALDTAIQLRLFEIISKAGEGAGVLPSDIAAQLPNSGPPEAVASRLDCVLRLLASYSLLTCSVSKVANRGIQTRYGLATAGKFFVRDENGASLVVGLRDFTRYQAGFLETCSKLKDAVLGGGNPFERAYGMPIHEYMKSNPDYRRIFQDFMTNYSVMIMKRVCEKYNGFEGLRSIVNVGGGSGVTLDFIISRYPSIHGINFDLPEVIEGAPSYKGVHHISGDMFVQVPQGDAILLKFILHNWSDDQCLQVLKNCYKALPKTGKVIILDTMLPDIPQDDTHSKMVSQFDYIMLMLYGSRERTKAEFEALAKKSGFSEFKVVCNAHSVWVMEVIKTE